MAAAAALLAGPTQKVTPEQRERLVAHDRAIERTEEARVQILMEKLVERLRPFVEAKNPGALGDAETVAWEARMRHETEDLRSRALAWRFCTRSGWPRRAGFCRGNAFGVCESTCNIFCVGSNSMQPCADRGSGQT